MPRANYLWLVRILAIVYCVSGCVANKRTMGSAPSYQKSQQSRHNKIESSSQNTAFISPSRDTIIFNGDSNSVVLETRNSKFLTSNSHRVIIIEGNNNTVTMVNDNVIGLGKNNSDTLILKGSNNSLGFAQKNVIVKTENVNTKKILIENNSFKNFQNQYTEPTVIDVEESSQVIVINGSYFLVDNNLSKIIPPAEAGDSFAQLHMGIAYLYGFGTSRNLTKALEWLTLSANSGNEDSQWILGDLYSIGNVIKMDLVEASKWYSKCASTGNDYCIKRLETSQKK